MSKALSLIIPQPIFALSRENGTERFPYRWRPNGFPALVIESAIPSPFGKPCAIVLKVEDGKNRERSNRYTSILKFRVGGLVKESTHQMEWVRDFGKFTYVNQPNVFSATFPGATSGWLMIVISEI